VSRSEAVALLQLAESIADGSAIDWEAAEASASRDDKAVIRELRILNNLAGLHRSTPSDSLGGPGGSYLRRDSASPAIGSWAHLTLLERLGGGTFGDVYRAWDRHLEREVALKLLKVDNAGEDLSNSRIANEGRLLARIRHQNVIAVHGVDAHDGRVGLWMDLVRGATLEQQLAAHGPFSAREAAAIGVDLCRALAAIHAAGLIHRDVKAQNVMREDGGRIVLMDLGTGRDAERGVGQGVLELAGTPLYLAPEIFTGSPASARTDVYSLGVLLYHLVTGSFPVRAANIDQLQRAHAAGDAVRLRDARADLPTAFVRIVDRAIASEPAKRYQSAGELEADLADAIGRRDQPVEEAGEGGGFRWLTGVGLAVAAVVVIVGALAMPWTRRMLTGKAIGPIQSVAVLPLSNLSGDAAQDYLADGITDELIGTLGRLGRVSVISRTSSARFKGSTKTIPEIARALNVDAIVEGSVVALNGTTADGPRRVRVNARLIYAGTDTQVWDRSFERVMSDLLTLETEMAAAVADGVKVRLAAPLKPVSQVNPQSYEAYLRGRYYWNKRTPEDLRRALDEFKRAVDLDPTSALAWSGLADGYDTLANYDDQAPRQVKPQAKAAAQRALGLDDSLAEAHAALGEVQSSYDWDLAAGQASFDRAIARNPNYASAHQWRGIYLMWSGRFDEALPELTRARDLDPLSPIHPVNVARVHFYARRYDEAIRLLTESMAVQPDFWAAHSLLGQVYLAQGRYDDAIGELQRARQLTPSTPRNLGVLGNVYALAGRRADAQQLQAELAAMAQQRYVAPVYPAMIAMGLGDRSGALDLLEQAFTDRLDWLVQLRVEPDFDPLRTEPRFVALLERAAAHPAP
jgi:TolB-like protein/Tfp pilus assembly protein PilF